jgi:histidinol-phosphatase
VSTPDRPDDESTVHPDVAAADLATELSLALRLADIADAITLPYYANRSFHLDWKANRTEVTEADRNAEAAIADAVLTERPAHGLFGEEHGLVGDPTSPWRWVVDPVDGTSNFVRGIPVWASLIALTHVDAGPVVGVVSAPAMGRRWWAARRLGAFADGRPIRVSSVSDLADAQVSVTFSSGWDALGLTGDLVRLQQHAYRARGFGDFWQHMLVAEGAVDLAIDAIGLQPYDCAAVMVVVEEAGGTWTDRHGVRGFEQDSAVSSNGLLHRHIEALGAGGS